MKQHLKDIGIQDDRFELETVQQLISQRVLEKPLDGNHGELHPKGDDFVTDGVPFIMATDVKDGHVDYSSCSFITAQQANSLRKGFSVNGDVLLTHKATIGRTAIVKYDKHPYIMLTPQVTYYRVKNNLRLNNHYLRYYFNSGYFQTTLQLWADSGSTRAYLGITGQQKLPVILPLIQTQRKIAALLSAYDELIEINKRRIALLEKMAEEIYREWFVRLRFPEHEKVQFIKGLPDGWKLIPSSDVFHVLSGGTPDTDNPIYWDGEIPFFTPRDAVGNFYVLKTEKLITKKGLDTCNSQLYKKDTVFITARGTVGKICLAFRDMAMNQSCYALLPKNGDPIYFYFLSMKNAIAYIKGIAKSGVFDNIVIDTFKIVPIFLPRRDLIFKFNEITAPIFNQIGLLLEANECLTTTRENLLPRLISGKLSVENLNIQFPPGMAKEVNAQPSAAVHA